MAGHDFVKKCCEFVVRKYRKTLFGIKNTQAKVLFKLRALSFSSIAASALVADC